MRLWWWAKRTSRERKRKGRTTLAWLLATSTNGELSRVTSLQNSRFSSLIAAGDVSRRGTSVTRQQKLHTNDVNQCLHNKPFLSCFSPRTIRNGKKMYPLAPRKESPPPMCSTLYSQLLLLTLGTTSKYVYVRSYVWVEVYLKSCLYDTAMTCIPEWVSCQNEVVVHSHEKTKRLNQSRSRSHKFRACNFQSRGKKFVFS